MSECQYRIQYLPLFYKDLEEKIDYISGILKNPEAANQLIDAVEMAIIKRLPYAESFEQYHSVLEKQYPYYRIYVSNYVIYYVVIEVAPNEKIMEVRRLLYSKQRMDSLS